MSDHQSTDFFNLFHDPFVTYQYNNLLGQAGTAPTSAGSSLYDNSSYNSGITGMSFSESLDGSVDYNALARAFGLSSSEDLLLSAVNEGLSYGKVQRDQMVQGVGDDGQRGGRGRSTGGGDQFANSSISSSSGEASGGEEDCSKKENKVAKGSHAGEDGDGSKKQNKQNNKKGEKKQREPRFAFMTKSEVDHLEDGYRWRKYGQKAVKNSPYPRSYYRCTTQKCSVKKRVERSFQDPSVVITTYEGQHNHPIPTTLRGSYNASGLMFSSTSSLSPASFNLVGGGGQGAGFTNPHDVFLRMPHQYDNNTLIHGSTIMEYNNGVPPSLTLMQLQQRRHQRPFQSDYGLLQDMVNPSASFGDHKLEQP
uniref:WRKY domain-containing protein n=1 Tax=Kalanchoe fedtschenkoi TaxID=63787 RepID=A0A7N0RE70_KALFE